MILHKTIYKIIDYTLPTKERAGKRRDREKNPEKERKDNGQDNSKGYEMKTHTDAGEHRQLSASDSKRFLGLHLHASGSHLCISRIKNG